MFLVPNFQHKIYLDDPVYLEEAKKITPHLVAEELQGLPKNKFHCSNLGAQALHKAIKDYQAKKKVQGRKERWPNRKNKGNNFSALTVTKR